MVAELTDTPLAREHMAQSASVDECAGHTACHTLPPASSQPSNVWITGLEGGFYNALTLCLQHPKQPPNRILIVGGCRQRDLAEYVAMTYPNAKIALLDPDADQVEQAKADIHCRFHFMHAPLEQLPLPNDSVDWVIAHQVMDYTHDWPKAAEELGRVAKTLIVASVALPWRSKLVRRLPQVTHWLTQTGCGPVNPVAWNDVLRPLMPFGKVKKFLEPLPWRLIALEVKPVKEQRLTLT
jgi:SAM-dependent methyltransferase